MIAQNNRNKILSNIVLLDFFPGCLEKLKNGKKRNFLPQKWPKNRKFSKNSRKFFLVGIDSEWFKTYFKMKISILKIFPVEIFFWYIAVFSKN